MSNVEDVQGVLVFVLMEDRLSTCDGTRVSDPVSGKFKSCAQNFWLTLFPVKFNTAINTNV